jgi:hypothetical protein
MCVGVRVTTIAVQGSRRIEELKTRPLSVEAPQKLFHYDPDKPLTFAPKNEKK